MQQTCVRLLVWILQGSAPPCPFPFPLAAFRFPLSAFLLLPLLLDAQVSPVIVTQPSSRTNIAGTTATFFVGATGSEPLRYQWMRDTNEVVLNATNSVLTLPSVQAAQGGVYTVVITNIAGGITSAPAWLVVRQPPRILQQPTNVLAVPGSSASFTVAAAGDPPLSYQWFHDLLAAVSGGTNATLVLTNLGVAHAGSYQV